MNHAPNTLSHRLSRFVVSGEDVSTDILFGASEVIKDLSKVPKEINSKYYYDDRGCLLFEHLCEEPSYYLTRSERAIVEEFASELLEW